MLNWLDERLGTAGWARAGLRKVFPDHWSFLLGEIALFCLVVLVLTGVYLTLFYVPDATPVTYDGPYAPLRGQEMSAAFRSVLRLSFEVQAGLVMRQVHHWAALVFVAAIVVHMARVFFTGAFRRPRELNWLVGISLLLLALAMGLTGYSLPDDLLSGTGIRVVYSVALSIPFIGPGIAFLLFGGEYPGESIISRLFVFHIMLLPAVLLGGVAVHLFILWLQKHTQFAGPGRTNQNVVGKPFWPSQVFKSFGLFMLTSAVLALMGGIFQINPIWTFGPYAPTQVSAPSQPDWYMGWLDGALRIFPPIEFTLLGVTIPNAFIAGVVIPGIVFTFVIFYPFIEALFSGDHEPHQLLDRPRDRPARTAIGVAGLTFFVILTLAAGNDVAAVILRVSVEGTTRALQGLIVVGPVIAGVITYNVCKELRRRERMAPHTPTVVELRRTPDGGWEAVEPDTPD
jgi:ubiquinol-cytochrome c reductase cytochrome b subunit